MNRNHVTLFIFVYRVKPGEEVKMPFWKKDKETEAKGKEKEGGKEKVNYKARLEHKQYLVSCRFTLALDKY